MEDSGEEMKSKPPPHAYVETNETKPLLKSNMDAGTNGLGSLNRNQHVFWYFISGVLRYRTINDRLMYSTPPIKLSLLYIKSTCWKNCFVGMAN